MRFLGIVCCVMLFSLSAAAKQAKGNIPNAATAIELGRAKLVQVYGKKTIDSEEPLTARLQDGIWSVWGTLWCTDRRGQRTNMRVGGVAQIRIREADGKVLSISHTK